jgi:tetratricopeptide (TPR) repeat protein
MVRHELRGAALALWASMLMGCGFAKQPMAVAADSLKACAATKEIKKDNGDTHYRPLTAPELVQTGNRFRDSGLAQQSAGSLGRGEGALNSAADCYGRALQLAPDNFAANFGLGVAYLARAKNFSKKTDRKRESLIASSKRLLGRSYALRHGHLEALFYLAELSVIQEDFARAKGYLDELRKRNFKAGPVAALLGFMAEVQGNEAQAQIHYEQALMAGWPIETLVWVSAKVKR